MSLSEENIALFDRYIHGELSKQEKAVVDSKLLTDTEFNERFKNYNMSLDYIKTYSIGQEMGNIIDQGYRKKNTTWFITGTAATIFIITLSVISFNYFKSRSNQELFTTYYTPYPPDQNMRGMGQHYNAMSMYSAGRYVEAIPLFEALITSDSIKQHIHLFLGNCYLEINNTSKAVENFKASSEVSSTILTQNGEWYLALTYLKEGHKEKAIEQLKIIASSNHLFREKARRLLNDLD